MKRKFKPLLSLLLAVGLTAGFSNCSNDDDQGSLPGGSSVEAGKKAYFSLSFSMPQTYATPDDGSPENGTPAESTINTVDVFIFTSATGDFLTHKQIAGSSFSAGTLDPVTGQQYTSTEVIETKSGDNSIYVGINLPAAVQADIVAKVPSLGRNALYLEKQLVAYTIADETGSNFVMGSKFNDPSFLKVAIPPYDPSVLSTQINVKTNVVRSAVKFAVEKAATVTIDPTLAGGAFTLDTDNNPLINFDLGNVNKSMFTAQKTIGDPQDPNFSYVVVDPNYDSIPANVGAGLYPIAKTGTNVPTNLGFFSKVVSVFGLTNNTIEHLYGLENTTPSNSFVGNVTYVALKTVFTPQGYSTGASFGAIRDNLGAYTYYDTSASYNAAVAGMPATSKAAGWFENGEVYYTVYTQRAGTKNFNVYRNDFFKLTISKINSLGDPNPGPKDPLLPLVDDAKITVEINVLPWNLLTINAQLDGQ